MILFLDIDGVLNPFGLVAPAPPRWGDETVHYVDGFRMILSQARADAIKALGVDIVWCSTWQDRAHRVGSILDIEAPFLFLDRVGWKRGAVYHYLREHPQEFIWIDDEPGNYGTMNHLGTRGFEHEGFIVNPIPHIGLTPEHIEDIKQWLEAK